MDSTLVAIGKGLVQAGQDCQDAADALNKGFTWTPESLVILESYAEAISQVKREVEEILAKRVDKVNGVK